MIGQPLRKLLIYAACLFLGATAHAAGEPTADPVAAAIGSSEVSVSPGDTFTSSTCTRPSSSTTASNRDTSRSPLGQASLASA